MGALMGKLSALWNRLGSEPGKEGEEEEPHTEFVRAVVEAVEKGDLEKLQHMQEESGMMLWGGLENVGATPSLIQTAAARGHEHILKYLIDLGADVDDTDTCGMSALHEACKKKHMGCIRLLVSKTRNIDRRDVWGRTPLIKALVYRNTEAAEFLLEKGANPNAVDIYGITPLSTALDYNLMEILRCLVRHGADVNLITQHLYKSSGPPLFQAINNQNVTMVNELIRMGANTQPRPQDYANCCRSRQYVIGRMPQLYPVLQHSDAVTMAMAELLRRDVQNIDVSGPSMEILMAVLAAHGHPLGSSPDVLVRVLMNSRTDDFSVLLHKLQVCSSSSQENLFTTSERDPNVRSPARPLHLQQMDQHLAGANGGQKPPRIVMSLHNQARRVARRAMMASGRNVVWATKRVQCPPALKSLLLLKDIDRAFAPPLLKKLDIVPGV